MILQIKLTWQLLGRVQEAAIRFLRQVLKNGITYQDVIVWRVLWHDEMSESTGDCFVRQPWTLRQHS
jgi:hypothetical protein